MRFIHEVIVGLSQAIIVFELLGVCNLTVKLEATEVGAGFSLHALRLPELVPIVDLRHLFFIQYALCHTSEKLIWAHI
jgi:hypothetical protein